MSTFTLAVALHLLVFRVEIEGLRHAVGVVVAPDLHFEEGVVLLVPLQDLGSLCRFLHDHVGRSGS